MYRLLIVDDEIDNVYWLEEMFQYDLKEELEVHTAVSGKEALELLNRIRFDVVLTDIKMPGMTGMELYDRIRENWPACKVIFLTAYPQFEDIYRVSQDKDVKYILKSEEEKVIKATVEEAFEEIRQMTRRKEELRQDQWMKYCVERENFRELLESLRKKGELPKKWEKEGNCCVFTVDTTNFSLEATRQASPFPILQLSLTIAILAAIFFGLFLLWRRWSKKDPKIAALHK